MVPCLCLRRAACGGRAVRTPLRGRFSKRARKARRPSGCCAAAACCCAASPSCLARRQSDGAAVARARCLLSASARGCCMVRHASTTSWRPAQHVFGEVQAPPPHLLVKLRRAGGGGGVHERPCARAAGPRGGRHGGAVVRGHRPLAGWAARCEASRARLVGRVPADGWDHVGVYKARGRCTRVWWPAARARARNTHGRGALDAWK